ncbi:MAG TPA: hypothetical protein VK588_14985 [Chitinophagaceae bacterium]|nr:hypothetical protein [Chitinophagaceae bacterium]
MRGIFTERNIVVVLFVMVLITFSMAQNETKRIEQLYNGGQSSLKKFPDLKPQAKAPIHFAHQLRTVRSS